MNGTAAEMLKAVTITKLFITIITIIILLVVVVVVGMVIARSLWLFSLVKLAVGGTEDVRKDVCGVTDELDPRRQRLLLNTRLTGLRIERLLFRTDTKHELIKLASFLPNLYNWCKPFAVR